MSQAKRDWSAFDYKSYKLVTSPSAMETANDCMRKWWFLKTIRLKEPQKSFTKLGDVFHEVCERWLEADDNGRGEDGKEADVFPDGWADALDYGQEAVVRAIFKAFVDEGVLRRTPGRQIEKSFQVPVIPGASIMGFADVWTPLGIEDHKTSKARKWLKNRDDLAECIQMMSYAAAWCFENRDATKLELRHNQGITDPDDLFVKPTSRDVTVDEVATFWDKTIIPLVKRMLYWKQAGLPPESWAKVDGPKPRKGICKKYGGCPFLGICGRTESVDAYKKRIAPHIQTETEKAALAQETDMSEDLLARLAKKKKARASAGVAAPTPQSDETEPVADAVEQQETESRTVENATADGLPDIAPWGNPGCKACAGIGISTAGAACLPCGINAKKIGVLVTDFKITPIEGAVEIRRGDILLAVVPVAVEVKSADNTKPTTKSEAKSEAKSEEVAPSEKAEKTEEEAKQSGKGRPKKGFTMIYGVVKRGKGKIIDLQQVMFCEGKELAEAWNAKSYYALDAFKRREALAMKAEELAEEFGPAIVMVSTDQRDLLDFAAALEPWATAVYVTGMR